MVNVDHSAPIYPIGIVQKLTGLSGRQIRYYEQQNLLQPKRTKGNQRIYSQSDVDMLICIKELLAKGIAMAGIRTHLATQSTANNNPATPTTLSYTSSRSEWSAHLKLASLYPVNNQAALTHLLETRRANRNLRFPPGYYCCKEEHRIGKND